MIDKEPTTIVRVGIFNSLNGEEWLENVKLRVAPAIRQLPGNLGSFWLQDRATGKVLSISFWDGKEALRSNRDALRNIPLQPGQDPTKIPTADAQEFYEVVYATADVTKRP